MVANSGVLLDQSHTIDKCMSTPSTHFFSPSTVWYSCSQVAEYIFFSANYHKMVSSCTFLKFWFTWCLLWDFGLDLAKNMRNTRYHLKTRLKMTQDIIYKDNTSVSDLLWMSNYFHSKLKEKCLLIHKKSDSEELTSYISLYYTLEMNPFNLTYTIACRY